MPFERFTVKARQVVVAAQEEARRLKHDHIDTEHILLALLDAPDSTAATVLHRLGYDKQTAQADIAALVGPGTGELSGHIPFTARAKKTLELALREATQLHHNEIGTEHILLALVGEGGGVGAKVLAERITPVGKIRAAVLASVQGSPEAPADSWPAGTPATADTVAGASALAGGAPVGSHHLLEAMLRAENSMAARVLRELGVDPDTVAAKIDELDPESTSDANPEEAAARRMELRLLGEEVHLILRDPATVTLAKQVTELSGGAIQGSGPVAGLFVPLWRAADQLLAQLRRMLEPESGEEHGTAKVVRTVLGPRLRRRTG
ncbi:Clp protease N-terminal domain-containing protein [Sciscionella sediminilitoris]|uniref:Clp protease N-terminal domain-containing protein n=1 Tax=Sciscionella sediminilitoris TaxID=1445613 RepID=UPI0004DF164D|nr:Clp protease N-terminal domain-containing protein [Sciscionella sp. SE31]